jgi:ACR3 family arsenite efflux pump ArsB
MMFGSSLKSALEVASVNLPVAVLIWLMIIPMLVKIDFGALGQVALNDAVMVVAFAPIVALLLPACSSRCR